MKPYKNLNSSKKKQVEKMFDSISFEYDKLNRLISGGNDVKWRKNIYKIAESLNPVDILDIATGTADIALELSKIKNSKITGLDISEKMLDVGRKKVIDRSLENKVSLISGDAENLSFSKNSFDLISIGFGVRNFQNLEKGLSESFRVLREGGTLIILETSVPQNNFVKFFYLIFSRTFIPLIGSLFSKDKRAYTYLQKSAEKFPSGKSFSEILKSCGFKSVEIMPLMLGASSIYIAKKVMKNSTEKISNNSFFEIADSLLKKKQSFFCSRLPGSKKLSLSSGTITQINRSEIKGNGIYIMPFNEKNLGFMLNPSLNYETIIEKNLNSITTNSLCVEDFVNSEDKENYSRSVKSLIKEIDNGKLSKIVFSKKITFNYSNSNCVSFFKNVLDLYKEAFCYLFFTPEEGVWMGASPELLFHKEKNSISTMALAGTKFNISSGWGDKEFSEQKIVQDEIIESLSPLCTSLSQGKTETVSAGEIQHLKTSFKGITQASTVKLVNALFPSSAIAGYPRKTALQLISKHESHKRSFYSGFLGACKSNSSSLFVNLRCISIRDKKISIYVGSGITKDSNPENEWIEILKKAETMLNVIF